MKHVKIKTILFISLAAAFMASCGNTPKTDNTGKESKNGEQMPMLLTDSTPASGTYNERYVFDNTLPEQWGSYVDRWNSTNTEDTETIIAPIHCKLTIDAAHPNGVYDKTTGTCIVHVYYDSAQQIGTSIRLANLMPAKKYDVVVYNVFGLQPTQQIPAGKEKGTHVVSSPGGVKFKFQLRLK